jgi:sec-independent protein translocase protein TatA
VNLGPWEILIIAVVIVLLFGARKMPAMARSLGQSMRILKAETSGMRKDEERDDQAPQAKEAPVHLPSAQQSVDPVQAQKNVTR